MDDSLEKRIRKDLKQHARAINLPEGAADSFIDNTLVAVKKKLKNKTIITEEDLTRIIVKELKKYNADFTYVYQIHDKII